MEVKNNLANINKAADMRGMKYIILLSSKLFKISKRDN